MERPFTENSQEIEVLDGQISVEELLAELGFDWSAEKAASGGALENPDGETFTQPALF
ncbi:hypothetical protein [Pseudarthrobacter enclensis]|uniref:Uncharacterized protein n=1 Tax=Pseudarthrobacter enclensis TaxID=993070 RepID=A0ABT9RXP1_9MICC|nr:hypothetical protein [Pseudarthrobacter enclensis]MDP9889403.1 hypothetical protein [Pseudarthrobacter enclensis]